MWIWRWKVSYWDNTQLSGQPLYLRQHPIYSSSGTTMAPSLLSTTPGPPSSPKPPMKYHIPLLRTGPVTQIWFSLHKLVGVFSCKQTLISVKKSLNVWFWQATENTTIAFIIILNLRSVLVKWFDYQNLLLDFVFLIFTEIIVRASSSRVWNQQWFLIMCFNLGQN